MQKMMKKIMLLIATTASCSLTAISYFERSLLDVNFRSHIQRLKKHELLIIPSISFAGQGRTATGDKVNPLEYLAATQNALGMLKGFTVGTPQDQLAQQINIDDDDGIRGHFALTGNWSFESAIFAYKYHPFNEWIFSIRTPFYAARVSNTQWIDQTQNTTYDDALAHQLVTDQLFSNVAILGNLNLTDWSKQYMGDTTLSINWMRTFLQEKEWLKEVGVTARIGLELPTGYRKNEDVAFSYAFGNDGGFGMPFGGGIDMRFRKLLRAGIDVSFEYIFSHTKNRRIMTDESQTDFLFLQKASTRKEYGITQMFNLYLEPQITNTMALRVAYQHTKHGNDRLYILNNDFSSITANKAAGLKEWTTHNLFVQLRYDNAGSRAVVSPIFSVFAQVPFNGRRSLQAPTLGCNVAIHF